MTQPTPASTRHPRGIYTLYFTEMCERMSYYGMRALLILYMTAELARSGMGLDEATAGAIYGLYTCAVYLVALLILILAVPASALWLAIAWTLATFWGVHRAAAWMLVPYLTWVSFAALLNVTLWRLNP